MLHNGPLLLEEKLQDLFSKFLSELSGTIETIPGTLLESCVKNFREILNVSILDLFREEFMPALLDQILTSIRDNAKEKSTLSNNVLEHLKTHLDGKLDAVQDLILVNESQCHSNMEILGRNLSDMESKMNAKLSSISEQIGDLQMNEHNRFEQLKRRCGDIAAMNTSINSKLESLIVLKGTKDEH